jgi:hypothetical protein
MAAEQTAVEMENAGAQLSQGFVIASLGCFKPPRPEQTGFSAKAKTLTRSVIVIHYHMAFR